MQEVIEVTVTIPLTAEIVAALKLKEVDPVERFQGHEIHGMIYCDAHQAGVLLVGRKLGDDMTIEKALLANESCQFEQADPTSCQLTQIEHMHGKVNEQFLASLLRVMANRMEQGR